MLHSQVGGLECFRLWEVQSKPLLSSSELPGGPRRPEMLAVGPKESSLYLGVAGGVLIPANPLSFCAVSDERPQ